MIKLQLLLRRPSLDIALDPAVRAALEAHGMTVTGSGRASVTAQMTEDGFERLFGMQPSQDLPLPPGLADAVSLITITPRHTSRVNHAAI